MNERKVSCLTNFEVVLVRKRVFDRRDEFLGGQDGFAHGVHGRLDAGAVVLGEDLHGGIARLGPGGREETGFALDGLERRERLPVPGRIDFGAENAVVGLGESGEFIAPEAVEGGAGALQDQEASDRGLDVDARAGNIDLDVAGLVAVAEEGVRMRLAVDGHARPAVGDDADVRDGDVGVAGEEVLAEDGAKELWRIDGVLLGGDVDGVLDRVGRNDAAVVGLGVAVVRLLEAGPAPVEL